MSRQLDLGLDLEAIAAGEGAVWVLTTNGKVLKLDPDTGDQSASAEVPGGFNVTVGESAVWALGSETEDGSGGALTRIDSSGADRRGPGPGGPGGRRRRRARVRLGPQRGRGLTRHDPETGLPVGEPIPVGNDPLSVTVGEGSAWVAAAGEGAVYRVTP